MLNQEPFVCRTDYKLLEAICFAVTIQSKIDYNVYIKFDITMIVWNFIQNKNCNLHMFSSDMIVFR